MKKVRLCDYLKTLYANLVGKQKKVRVTICPCGSALNNMKTKSVSNTTPSKNDVARYTKRVVTFSILIRFKFLKVRFEPWDVYC